MAWHYKKLQLDNFKTVIFDNSLTNAMRDLVRNSCSFSGKSSHQVLGRSTGHENGRVCE